MLKKAHMLFVLVIGLGAVLLLAGFTNGGLPPRPTPAPTAVPRPTGERIQLQLENEVDEIPPSLWTVVEWQDPTTGDWHIVEGWRGTLDTPTTQTWWVGSELFGAGPFRWQLYAYEDGGLLATSNSFYLPERAGRMVVVNVMLESDN
jgi:hypothetical protein